MNTDNNGTIYLLKVEAQADVLIQQKYIGHIAKNNLAVLIKLIQFLLI